MVKTNHLPQIFRRQTITENIEKICRANDIVFMALFGSFARGKNTPKSDIDILVRFDRHKEKSLLDLIHTEHEMAKVFRQKVDLLTPASLSPYLKDKILSSAKVIYEKR